MKYYTVKTGHNEWRVHQYRNGTIYELPLVFGTQRDAEIAISSLKNKPKGIEEHELLIQKANKTFLKKK